MTRRFGGNEKEKCVIQHTVRYRELEYRTNQEASQNFFVFTFFLKSELLNLTLGIRRRLFTGTPRAIVRDYLE